MRYKPEVSGLSIETQLRQWGVLSYKRGVEQTQYWNSAKRHSGQEYWNPADTVSSEQSPRETHQRVENWNPSKKPCEWTPAALTNQLQYRRASQTDSEPARQRERERAGCLESGSVSSLLIHVERDEAARAKPSLTEISEGFQSNTPDVNHSTAGGGIETYETSENLEDKSRWNVSKRCAATQQHTLRRKWWISNVGGGGFGVKIHFHMLYVILYWMRVSLPCIKSHRLPPLVKYEAADSLDFASCSISNTFFFFLDFSFRKHWLLKF